MTLSIDFPPHVSARIAAFARKRGIDQETAVERIVTEHLAPEETQRTAENDPALALLESWLAAAPTDPEEIRDADADRGEFLKNLNRNRIESGERPLFP